MRGVPVGSRQHAWHCAAESICDGYTLRSFRWGAESGSELPTLVFVHGMEEGWDVWSEVCRRLDGKYHMYALDLPWHGRDGYRWTHIGRTAHWLQIGLALLTTPVHALVAHSLGANGFLELAQGASLPDLQATVLVSPFYRSSTDQFSWDTFFYYANDFPRLLKHGLETRMRARTLDADTLERMAEKVYERIGPLGWLEFFNQFVRTPELNLDRFSFPSLVIGGADDFASMPFGNVALARALPVGELAIFPDCGHFCMLEQPDRFTEAVDRFLVARLSGDNKALNDA